MGADAEHSVRVSVGWSTTDSDVDALVSALPRVIDRLRALTTDVSRPGWARGAG
jgi:cysteine sulfinate desulfinase/cysteine desulfurase-like protein